jgi:hypothetical protein
MKTQVLALPLALCLFAGCASPPAGSSASPSPPAPPSPPAAQSPPRPSPERILEQAAAAPSLPFEGDGWQALGNTNDLAGWRETQFAGRGQVERRRGLILLNMGDPFTGINWTNDFPKLNYEVALDAMRVVGSDFFCGLTVPVGDSFCSLIVGGWGGGVVGISSLDGFDASENETTKYITFENGRWYRLRLRVTAAKLEAWIDADKVVEVKTADKRISLRPGEIDLSKPFGLASWETTAALRNIKMRPLLP